MTVYSAKALAVCALIRAISHGQQGSRVDGLVRALASVVYREMTDTNELLHRPFVTCIAAQQGIQAN